MLVASLYGAKHECEVTRAAAEVLCTHLRHRMTGTLPTGKDFRRATELGAAIAEGGWAALHDVEQEEILMKY